MKGEQQLDIIFIVRFFASSLEFAVIVCYNSAYETEEISSIETM